MTRAAAEAPGLPHGILPLVAVDLHRVSIAEGMRAALSTAAIVAANEWLQWPPMMEAALASLFTCLCDPGGPIRRRLPAILCFGVLGALLTVGFGVLRNAPLWCVVPVACLGIFVALYVRVLGQAAQQIGNLLTVAMVLALIRPIPDLRTGLELGLAFWGGSLWAALLTLAIWRIYPFRPARRAVAQAYRALAALVSDLGDELRRAQPDEASWDAHARRHRRAVRDALERAREAARATLRARGPASGRAALLAIRLEAADQIFGVLIGLTDLLAAGTDEATRGAARRLLRVVRPALGLIAHGIETDVVARLPRLDRAAERIAAFGAASPALHPAANALAERLRIVANLALPGGWLIGSAEDESPRLFLRRVATLLRANLNWQSEMLRHALRAAVVAAPALYFTLRWETSYSYWLTIMLVMTLQPQVAMTFARALERIVGTGVGGLIAAGLAAFCTTPIAIAAALFPLAILSFAVRPASFGLFMTCLTPMVVLLSELRAPGQSPLLIAAMRGLYVVIGSGLAVAGVLVLWPSFEPGRLGRELRVAIQAHAALAQAQIGAVLGEVPPAVVEQARRAAGIASNNVEASVHRALLEPGQADAQVTAALTVDAALRRVAGRVAAMLLDTSPARDPAAWRAWRDWIDAAAQRVIQARDDLPPRPKLPEGDPRAGALTRIARQMELSAGALARARAAPEAAANGRAAPAPVAKRTAGA